MGKKTRKIIKKQYKKNTKSLKKGKDVIKKAPKINPRTRIEKVIKSGTENELENELELLEIKKNKNPSARIKNKEKRRELVSLRNSTKKRIKAKLRRKHQERQDEFKGEENDEEEEGEIDEEKEEKELKELKKIPKTIENQREIDETMIKEDDIEMKKALELDEYTPYFNGEVDPMILLTTSIKRTGSIFKFMRELNNIIPNSYFYYRKKCDLGSIMTQAIEKKFTDIIVVTERLKKPYKLTLIHLPNGPTLEFKLFNVIYQDQIEGHGTSAGFNPELIFKNFSTVLGVRTQRALNALFPHNEECKGREVITFHNQRDYIFFRYHRYIFNDSFDNVDLQELGPRFVMRLLSVQKGLFDPQGDYEWNYKDKMGVKRRKFYL